MVYAWMADAVMLVHFGFLVFVALGGFLAWRYRRILPLHVAAICWAAVSVFIGVACPLTALENRFRELAGRAALDANGFIDTYITGVVYPQNYLGAVRAAVAVLIAVSWAGLVIRSRRRTLA